MKEYKVEGLTDYAKLSADADRIVNSSFEQDAP